MFIKDGYKIQISYLNIKQTYAGVLEGTAEYFNKYILNDEKSELYYKNGEDNVRKGDPVILILPKDFKPNDVLPEYKINISLISFYNKFDVENRMCKITFFYTKNIFTNSIENIISEIIKDYNWKENSVEWDW